MEGNNVYGKDIGLIDAPFTPFYANGDVNLEPIEAYAAMLQKNGLKGVFINGSSGEGYMLTTEERMQLAERWMQLRQRASRLLYTWVVVAYVRAYAWQNMQRRLVHGVSEYGSSIPKDWSYRGVSEVL